MSTQRHCSIYLAKNGKWYMELAAFEYGRRDDSYTYGPFNSLPAVDEELKYHSNPGGSIIDNSGTKEVPTSSPNGWKIRLPTKRK